MEKLLHWSIANAQGDKEAIAKAGAPDPKLLQQLFGGGGPDDPTLMKEAMLVITNPEATLENRLVAFDNFEMLIENLDNANNIENMKLWTPILGLLGDSEERIRAMALSTVGTAVQNNVNSQDAFAKYDNSITKLIELAKSTSEPSQVRIKALYALSNLVRNHKDNCIKFRDSNGLDIIAPILTSNKAVTKEKMRAIALLTAFLSASSINNELIEVLRKDHIIESTISLLSSESDINLLDRVLNFLSLMISSNIVFSSSELEELNTGIQKLETHKDRLNEDDYLTVKYVL